jgi:hypothetical protein
LGQPDKNGKREIEIGLPRSGNSYFWQTATIGYLRMDNHLGKKSWQAGQP